MFQGELVGNLNVKGCLAIGSRERVLIIGSGMIGLLVAQMCSRHFQEVIIVEKDPMDPAVVYRSGIPQARHIHILLAKGKEIYEQYFPGFSAQLSQSGAFGFDFAQDVEYYLQGYKMPRFESGVASILCTRVLMERILIQKIRKNARVFLMTGHVVKKLLTVDSDTIDGVQVVEESTQLEKTIKADWVIDVSGSTSQAPKWLNALGFEPPKETLIDPLTGYASCLFRLPMNLHLPWKVFCYKPHRHPIFPWGAIAMTVEDRRLFIGLSGRNGVIPPIDRTSFLDYSRHILNNQFYELIKSLEPVSKISGYRKHFNRFRHYENLSSFPKRFLVLGDAACVLNSACGSGLTCGAMSVSILENLLIKSPSSNFESHFHLEQFKKNEHFWRLCALYDGLWPDTVGWKPTVADHLKHHYFSCLVKKFHSSPALYRSFLTTINMQGEFTDSQFNTPIDRSNLSRV